MSKALRLSEKWFQRGLWLVAFAFAGFLIGLGGQLVRNMDLVEKPIEVEQFIDPVKGPPVRAALDQADKRLAAASELLDQAKQQHSVARANSKSATETFDNWVATRRATARPEQDSDLIARTKELDTLKARERAALAQVEAQQQAGLDASQAREHANARWNDLMASARVAYDSAARAQELRLFLYRLALTLPLLLVAAWLFAKKRYSTYWPFVWGFILFAGVAFFVELVPYLPSYGGYVRYVVGIVATAVVGRFAIVKLQRYLARQKAEEALPQSERRQAMRYDVAVARLHKGVCPGCERIVDLKDASNDFCPHCGIGLFDRCGHCEARKSAFARFCHACGTPSKISLPD